MDKKLGSKDRMRDRSEVKRQTVHKDWIETIDLTS